MEEREGGYTLADYYALPDERRVELIDGVFYDMAAPSAIHQQFQMEIASALHSYLKRNQGKCRVFPAPFDVQLDRDDRTMVEPDISILCGEDRIRRFGCFGAPDMVIEILSPSTAHKDALIKLNKYVHAGVREYWLVDPEKKKVVVYSNLPEDLMPEVYRFDEEVPVGIWDGRCRIGFPEIYRDIASLYEK